MRTVALLSFLMLTAMLAGCTEVRLQVDDPVERPSMTFLEASSTLAEGTCGVGAEDCHIIRVQVNNFSQQGNGYPNGPIVPNALDILSEHRRATMG